MAENDGLYTMAEAAQWLKIGYSTLEKLVARRRVPFTRPTGPKGPTRFAQHHLDAIVAAGESPMTGRPMPSR
jgi:excisionase family DNA binding protein